MHERIPPRTLNMNAYFEIFSYVFSNVICFSRVTASTSTDVEVFFCSCFR
ncbi:protein of unknown function [Paenibacillus alvei]|uniref:Uncharacterized protein n=1 Tax=Paenibacillus alvei TaxID=44250 RepID=A0A383RDC6_PAEAL|nr:protein of unknown function [Paenibacillus alvei]